jgi:hypothetical protein
MALRSAPLAVRLAVLGQQVSAGSGANRPSSALRDLRPAKRPAGRGSWRRLSVLGQFFLPQLAPGITSTTSTSCPPHNPQVVAQTAVLDSRPAEPRNARQLAKVIRLSSHGGPLLCCEELGFTWNGRFERAAKCRSFADRTARERHRPPVLDAESGTDRHKCGRAAAMARPSGADAA